MLLLYFREMSFISAINFVILASNEHIVSPTEDTIKSNETKPSCMLDYCNLLATSVFNTFSNYCQLTVSLRAMKQWHIHRLVVPSRQMYENTLSLLGSGVQNDTFSIVWSITSDWKKKHWFYNICFDWMESWVWHEANTQCKHGDVAFKFLP